MNKFIELTEVADAGGTYDPTKEKISYRYTLKKVHLNISHIARIEENEELKQIVRKEDAIPGLNPSIASFSTIFLGARSNYDKVSVVGKPSIILNKLGEINGRR